MVILNLELIEYLWIIQGLLRLSQDKDFAPETRDMLIDLLNNIVLQRDSQNKSI